MQPFVVDRVMGAKHELTKLNLLVLSYVIEGNISSIVLTGQSCDFGFLASFIVKQQCEAVQSVYY